MSQNNDDIVIAINNIACELFNALGGEVSEDTLCYSSDDPEAARCWNAATVVYFNTVMRDSEDIDIKDYLRALVPLSAAPKLTLVHSVKS